MVKLSTKMAVGFSLIFITMLAIVAGYSYINILNQITEKTERQISGDLAYDSAYLDKWFTEKSVDIQTTAKIIKDNGNKLDYLNHSKNDKEYYDMYMGFPNGKLLAVSGWEAPDDYDSTSRDWYKDAIKSNSAVVSSPYIDADSKKLVITISNKLTDYNNNITGVLAADIFLNTLQDKVSKMNTMNGNGYAFLIYNDGTYGSVVSHPIKEIEGIEILNPEEAESNVKRILESNNLDLNSLRNLFRALKSNDEGITKFKFGDTKKTIAYKKLSNSNWVLAVSIPTDIYTKEISTFKLYYIILVCGLTMLIAFAIWWYAKFKIEYPLLSAMITIKRVINKDFTKQSSNLINRKDEVGELVRSVDIMRESLAMIVKSVVENSSNVNDSAIKVEQYISELNKQIDKISLSTDELSAGMQQNAASTQEINATIEELEASIIGIVEKSEYGLEITDKINKKAEELSKAAKKSEDDTSKIYKITQDKLKNAIEGCKEVAQISSLSDDILAITSQTNLLALNASIEAARVGEAGKGFTIVANEIKKLAERSKLTVQSIQNITKNAVDSVDNLVENSIHLMEFIENKIVNNFKDMITLEEQYSKDAKDFNNLIKEFNDTANEIKSAVQNIAKSMNDIAETTSEGANNTINISDRTSKVAEKSNDIVKQAEKSKHSSIKLQELVKQFKI